LFLPRFNTEFVSTEKRRSRFRLFWMAEVDRRAGQPALLESEIFSRTHRDLHHAMRPGEYARATLCAPRKGAPRPGWKVFAGVLLVAGSARMAGHGTGWGQAAGNPSAVTAQSNPQAPDVATLQVFSRLTVVDVTVTDAKGHSVQDLKQSDFTIKEGGKPQTIRNFLEIRENAVPAAHVPPKLPPDVYTNAQPSPTTSAVNILLLDGLNTQPADMVAMKQESIRYLKSMPRGTRIAVLTLTGSPTGGGLRIMQGFTSDPAVLIAVVDSKKNRALPSPFLDSDSNPILDDQADQQAELGNDDAAAAVQQFSNELAVEQQDVRNRMTLEALNQIAAYVAGIKARKNLIWFTDGMPINIFPNGGVNDLEGLTDYAKELRKTNDLLTAAEVAVYPVDARRLFSNPANGADQHLDRITVRTGAVQAANDQAFRNKKGGQLLGMEAVAEETGGAAIYNTNDLKSAVAKAIENGANYYTVAYAPSDLAYDGRYHTIDVEVGRPDVHLAYRKGYNADDILHNAITPELSLATSAPEPYGNNMQASMGRGVPTASQVLFDVRLAPSTEPAKPADAPVMGTLDAKLAGRPLVRYDVLYLVPARQITFTPGPGGTRKCSVSLDIAAYDVYGKLITGLSQTISSPAMTAEQYQRFIQRPFQPSQQIDLPPGEIFLRVGVLDGGSDKVGTLEIPLNVSRKLARPASVPGRNDGP
jgi:VWFA-related protein